MRQYLLGPVLFLSLISSGFAQDWLKDNNLAHRAKVTASSEQKGNFVHHAVDGDLKTRWCASGPQADEWLQLDLGAPHDVRSIRLHWEQPNRYYRHRIEGSADGKNWSVLVDRSNEEKVSEIPVLESVDARGIRYLKITYLENASGAWASIREVEVSSGELPKIPDPPVVVPEDIVVPEGFTATFFAIPPVVNYPVCLTAAPTGEVFVGVDEMGSLGKEPGRGKILRCVDTNGDGVADQITTFAKVDHPRGLVYDNGKLWVLHPPTMSLFEDTDGDGVADSQTTLIEGISTADVAARGADHTTNGIQIGIDGWIYIAVGDYGVTHAKGTDGRVLNRRGGGVIRFRPDGTDMEIYAWGLRNIVDVCIDPEMNIFTRDNTNDGGEWDVRLSQIFQSAEYGYPSLYMNFREEIMPPIADYGGGSGCGGMYLDDARWPGKFGHALYTCDWGRSEVYLHELTPSGPTFSATQERFAKVPRPTDVDVDGSGRMYIASWKNGMFNYDGPNVGFVAHVIPKGLEIKPFPDLKSLTLGDLVQHFNADNARQRQHVQLEILRRGRSADASGLLISFMKDRQKPIADRVAAMYTLKQLDGADSHPALLELLGDPSMQAATLRALTDRKKEVNGLPSEPFLAALQSSDPVVVAQAVISIGRLGRPELAGALIPLTRHSGELVKHNQPDPSRVIPHLAVRALIELGAAEACLKALNGPDRSGALLALRGMHSEAAVQGLANQLATESTPNGRAEILEGLIRLYHREGRYEKNWWGTRPDRTGPYYDRQTWEQSQTIADLIRNAYRQADPETATRILKALEKHQVKLEGIDATAEAARMAAEMNQPIVIPPIDPANKNQIANLPPEDVVARAMKIPGNPERGRELFLRQSCNACHTYAAGQVPKGPHLVDIGKRYKREELIESIINPSAKIAQGFDTYVFATEDGKIYTGFVTGEGAEAVRIRQSNGVEVVIPQSQIEERAKQSQSMMPQQVAGNLTPEELADLLAWLESLKSES